MPQDRLLLRKSVSDAGDAAVGYCFERLFRSSADDLRDPKLYRALIGEALGTAVLVLLGCASVTSTGGDFVGISLCFGLAVASMAWSLAAVSGGHINPAVSVAMLAARKCSLARGLLYVVAQCCGAYVGALLTLTLSCPWQLASTTTAEGGKCELGVTRQGVGVSAEQACAVELLITFVLVFVVFAACDGARADLGSGSAPLAIGLSVTLCHLAAIPLTGSSMNPARSFGPALLAGHWEGHWIYWAGPITGGVLAGLLYDLIFAADASISKIASWLRDPAQQRPAPSFDARKEASSAEDQQMNLLSSV